MKNSRRYEIGCIIVLIRTDSAIDLKKPRIYVCNNFLNFETACLSKYFLYFKTASNSQETEPNKDSYEELVMKRVAAYVAQSQDYIQSTDLAKRVRIWHEMLAPKLELVEQRGGFDIHEYGTKVLSKFPPDSR